MAAHATYKEGRQMLPSDLQKALYDIASDNDEGSVINVRNAQRKAKAAEMAESRACSLRPGALKRSCSTAKELWPEADVTLVDLRASGA